MKFIGKRGETNRISFYVRGSGGRIDVSGFKCKFAVGSIPRCELQCPPEMLSKIPDEQSNDKYELIVDDGEGEDVLFTGYASGDTSSLSGSSVSAGFGLTHIARDLDEARISAPKLHPASSVDYSYVFNDLSGSATGGAVTLGSSPRFFEKGKGKVSEQIVKSIQAHLKDLSSASKSPNGATAKQDMQRSIDLLNSIEFLDGKFSKEVEDKISGTEITSLNSWLTSRILGSITSFGTVWDTLTGIFSELGIYLVGNNEGKVIAVADCAGMSPQGNELNGTIVTGWSKSSNFYRNVGEVVLVSDNIRSQDVSAAQGAVGGFVTYPPSGSNQGASLAFRLPGWLNPIATIGDIKPSDMLAVQRQYARMIYTLERSKFSTAVVTTNIAPLAVPGTVCKVKPYSAMKARSGGGVEDFDRTYAGYCHMIEHEVSANPNGGRTMRTNFYLKNVTIDGKGAQINKHPLFDDVTPFTWK